MGVELEVLSLSSPEQFETTFRNAQGVGALIQIDDAMFTSHRQKLVELATKYRIPGSYGLREFVDIGGFMALGPSYPDLYRRAALVLDKILKGAKPADLPVEQANKFEVVIVNLKTAKALGPTDFADVARPRRRGDRMTWGAANRPPALKRLSLLVRVHQLVGAALERIVDGQGLGIGERQVLHQNDA